MVLFSEVDMRGTSVTFAVVKEQEPPWTLIECLRESNSPDKHLEFLPSCKGKYGAAIDVTLLVQDYLKWNIKLVWSDTWGTVVNGTWKGAVGEVMRHQIDSCVPTVR